MDTNELKYDLRQFKMMRNIIYDYNENKISLNSLVSNLFQLYNLINFSEIKWNQKFEAALIDLESVNSDILTKGEDSPNKNLYPQITTSALDIIKEMIELKINEINKLVEPNQKKND